MRLQKTDSAELDCVPVQSFIKNQRGGGMRLHL